MNKLWHYDDYVKQLSYENSLVRKRAFEAINSRYIRTYTDEVAGLLHDDDDRLVRGALRYLSYHQASQYAPVILEKFKAADGTLVSNCAIALARMNYEPALDHMLEKFSVTENIETALGIMEYLGQTSDNRARTTLQSSVRQIEDSFVLSSAVSSLLRHCHTEDITLVMERGFDAEKSEFKGSFLRDVLNPLDGSAYFRDLTEYGKNHILTKPETTLENLFSKNSHITADPAFKNDIIGKLKKLQYREFAAVILQEARRVVSARYADNEDRPWVSNLMATDNMCLELLTYISEQTVLWKQAIRKKEVLKDFISFIVSAYMAVMERGAYINAMHPEADMDILLSAVKCSGAGIPKNIMDRIKEEAPVMPLKNALSDDLSTWGDVWIVSLMGMIGKKEFLPDLIRVLKETDTLDYIYNDALTSVNTLEESADEDILTAVEKGDIPQWPCFDILDHLAYAESYDLAVNLWEDESDDPMDSDEILALCLEGIGDRRGIDYLRSLWMAEQEVYVGSAIECLCELHGEMIPELEDIRQAREIEEKRMKDVMNSLYDWEEEDFEYDDEEDEADFFQTPVRRETPKIGRNAPCPCGSGKKYKKCCLNK